MVNKENNYLGKIQVSENFLYLPDCSNSLTDVLLPE